MALVGWYKLSARSLMVGKGGCCSRCDDTDTEIYDDLCYHIDVVVYGPQGSNWRFADCIWRA